MGIDDKIVSATFDSRKFEEGVNKTLGAVDKLNSSLKFPNAGKGFNDIDAAAKKVNLSHIASGVQDVSDKLNSLRVVALAVFSSIAIQAVQTGLRVAKAFTIQPAIQGFQEYSTNLNAIQTILANTQAAGTNLDDVNRALQELNVYSDKTIYNFSQMARNIGTFTAAGVELDTATGAIKGIANLAALSGSNAEQASTAMYQLSQAISAGSVKLQDWNSVVNAGMGGTVFQRALAQTAEQVGTLKKGAVQLSGAMKNVKINGEAFRLSLSTPGKSSWLTSEVLTKTLEQFTGDLTDAELKAEGFNAAQIKAIQQTALTAQHAATEVKTITQVFQVAKETAGSGWAQTFQVVFGTFTEAKETFTQLSEAINGFINKNAEARNKVLKDWKALGGRALLITTIKNVFQSLGEIIAPIKDAFRDIFPAKTGRDLYDLTVRIWEFTEALKPSPETVDNLRRTFRGLFALMDIGKQVIVGIFHVFGKLFGSVGDGSGSFLNFTGNIGDFIVKVDQALKKGNRLNKFFEGIGTVLAVPVKLISKFIGVLDRLSSEFSSGGLSSNVDGVTDSMNGLSVVMEKISELWDKFLNLFSRSNDTKSPSFIEEVSEGLQNLGLALGKAFSNVNFELLLSAIQTGLLAGLVLLFKNMFGPKGFFGKGTFAQQLSNAFFGKGKNFGGGVLKNIGRSFKTLEGSMKSMQNNLKAKTLKEIAIAIGILVISIVALSFISPEDLKKSLAAIAVAMGMLLGAMAILDKIANSGGFLKMPFIAAAMILFAGAIDVLAIAVIALGRQNVSTLARGLGAVLILLGTLVGVSVLLSKYAHSLVLASVGITGMAVAINILALAVRQLGNMNPDELARGLGAVAILLGTLVGVSVLLSKYAHSLVLASIGIVAISGAMNILALAVHQLGTMDPKNLAKGLGAIAIALFSIAGAMHLMPVSVVLIGPGLLVVAVALKVISKVIKNMGGMDIHTIARGLYTLAASLVILAGGLYLMSGTLSGAAALGVAAVGLSLLVPAIVALGKQPWRNLVKGLLTIAGALALLGITGALIGPVIPALLGLGAAMLLIGGGLALAGAGIFLLSAGLSALVISAPIGVGVLIAAIIELEEAIPRIAIGFINGLLGIVDLIVKIAPKFVAAFVKIVDFLVVATIKVMPKLIKLFEVLIDAILKVIDDESPKIIKSGFKLLLDLLKGIRDNIGKILDVAGDIIVAFIQGLDSQIRKIRNAGIDFVAHFINGMVSGMLRLINVVARAVIRLLNGVADAIETYEPELLKATARIGIAIVKGIGIGLKDGTGALLDRIKELTDKMIDKLHLGWLIRSPSQVTTEIGQKLVGGLARGIENKGGKPEDDPVKAMSDVADNVTEEAKTVVNPEIMKKIGQNAMKGFAKGIREGSVQSSFTDLYDALSSSARQARETIAAEQKQLKELSKEPKKNAEAIKTVQAAITKNQAVLAQAIAGHVALTKTLSKEKIELTALVKEYNTVAQKLEEAKAALADAKQTRNEAFASISSQYGALPDIDTSLGIHQLEAYEETLKKSAEAVKAYHTTLEKLKKLGLDEQTYQKLLAEGTIDQAFADQLLEGGKSAVTALNNLDIQLNIAANEFTKSATANLYNAGVAAAQGLVDGLTDKKSGLDEAFKKLANLMITTIKKALDIKSPSGVFAEIGRFTVEGLAEGLINSSKTVTDAVTMISDDAMDSMRDSFSKISAMVSDEINPNPTITPILDLSGVKMGAKTLDSILTQDPITVEASASQASTIARFKKQDILETDSPVVAPGGTVIELNQTNTSPKALDHVEIYRQTKNLLSRVQRPILEGG